MYKVFDRVKVGTATTGTANLTLDAAEDGFQTWIEAGAADGDTVAYAIEDGSQFEVGYGVLGSSGTILNRNVIASSNAGLPINLSGNAVVFSAINKSLWDGKLSLDGGAMTGTLQSSNALMLEGTGGGVKTIRVSGGGSQMVLEQTGGQYGTTRLTILNETGANGAIFENTGPALVDFGFKTTAGQRNIRYETRAGTFLGGNTAWEFQFGGSPTETALFMIGDTQVYSWRPIYVSGNIVWNAGNFDPATKSDTGHTHTFIGSNDTRGVNDAPQDIAGGFRLDFKANTAVGSPPVQAGSGYAHILNVVGWQGGGAGGGGYNAQISVGDGLAVRQATGLTTWGPWRTLWHDGNFTPGNYVLTTSFTFANLGGKPTTLAGYGITDAAAKATTLAGYGITDAVPSAQKGVANGVATLDSGGKVPSAQLPSYVDDVLEYANLAGFPATGESGKIYIAIDTGWEYRWSGSTYVRIVASPGSTDAVPEGSTNLYFTNARAAAAAPVQSVAGKTGAVTLAKGDVGLGNVDNTSDADKPVSTATQTALDAKRSKAPNVLVVFSSSGAVTGTFDHDMVVVSANSNVLFGTPTGTAVDGWGLVFRVKDNGIARSLTYPASFRAVGVTLPTATTASKTLYLAFIYNAADAKWDCIGVQQQA